MRLIDHLGQVRFRQVVFTDNRGEAVVELPGDQIEPGTKLEVADCQPLRGQTHGPAARSNPSAADHEPPEVVAELPIQAEPVMAYFLLAEPAIALARRFRFRPGI